MVIMIIEFKCPNCQKVFEVDLTADTMMKCQACGESLLISQQFIDDAKADSLMDPADPIGMLNYFPEDE